MQLGSHLQLTSGPVLRVSGGVWWSHSFSEELEGWECSSVIECLSSMCDALGGVPRTAKQNKEPRSTGVGLLSCCTIPEWAL